MTNLIMQKDVLLAPKYDIKVLHKYKQKKLLKCTSHPIHNLFIWNYVDAVQFKKEWDPILLACRALVTDNEGNVIARSFPKFFNLEEDMHDATPDFRIFDKADGSLGLLFWYELAKEWIVASRGSFASEQAERAKQILDEKHSNYTTLNKEMTYVFEIIYPENRIVLDYADKTDLIYLSSFMKDGTEVMERHIFTERGFEVVKEYDHEELDKLKAHDEENREGYVILFSNGQRIKIKFENYLKLHRTVSHLDLKQLLKWFKNGDDPTPHFEEIPDEFADWFNTTWKKIQDAYTEKLQEIADAFHKEYTPDKKVFATAVEKYPYRHILFALYSEKDVRHRVVDILDLSQINNLEHSLRRPSKPHQPTLIVCCGISGSGKSTWAKEYVDSHPNSIIVSRDNLRLLLFGENEDAYYRSSKFSTREKTVSQYQALLTKNALLMGHTVVLDNTNLRAEYITAALASVPSNTLVYFKTFDITVEEALERINTRPRKINPDVVSTQFKNFQTVRSNLSYTAPEPLVSDTSLPLCIIFDIDGTLAINDSGRSPYDMKRVQEDLPNQSIVTICQSLNDGGYNIVICSGRDESARSGTMNWLNKYKIVYKELHLRKLNDTRKDYTVKEEMWRDIAKRYNIISLFDDRDGVVDHARRLGMTCCQVNYGAF